MSFKVVDRHNQMFRDDGSYDFKKREDWDYKHGYSFMCGWLGQDEAKAELKKKKLLGKVDDPAPPIPLDRSLAETIEKTAVWVKKSQDPQVFERVIMEKNKGKEGWGFLEDGAEGNDYYKFCLHAAERQVDPRPLAEQARKVKEDREVKQANAKANVFVMGSGEAVPPKEAKYKDGELMEVIGVKSKPDYNGKIVKVIKFHPDADRYEVKFEGGRYDQVIVKLREENLMYSAVEERDPEKDKELAQGEIPNGTRVEVRGLQSETARWMNGQKGLIVCWDKEAERYEIRLDYNNLIKKVKPTNVRIELPEDWEEHWDEHLQRHYYLNNKTQKVTWKHPKAVINQRAKFGKIRENNIEEWEEEKVDIDAERQHYDVDDEEEGEGHFDLNALVKKVETEELKRQEAEEKGEEYHDSDDGMYSVAKQKKKKKKKKEIKIEDLQEKLTALQEHTMVGRASVKKDFTLLEGHFIAVKEIDPVIKKLEHACTVGNAPDDLLKFGFEILLAGLEKACVLLSQLTNTRMTLIEVDKLVNRITSLSTQEELLKDCIWVSTLLKTM